MKDKKQEILCGREPMVINEERMKHGLAPISGGDVAITRISDSNKELSPQD